MTKILKAYIENQTTKNAKKLASYAKSHPMAEAFLTPEQYGWLRQAKIQAAA